jgi:hypothetical protein
VSKDKKEHTGDDEQIAADRRLNEQCFLLSNMNIFQGWGVPRTYDGLFKLNGDDPVKFITKLVSRKGLGDIMKLKPAAIAALTPHIKLYKVYYESETSEGDEYELIFENSLKNSAVDAILTSRKGRGEGCGIKSFEFNLNGGNPVEASRMVEAKLVLYFQSMDDMFKTVKSKAVKVEKGGLFSSAGPERKVKYVDLIHQNAKFKTEKCTGGRTYNNKYFRIKATVGWSAPESADDETKQAAKVMEQASATFFLTMTKHDLSFDDLGMVTLTIDYMAAPEGAMSDPKADVLAEDSFIADLLGAAGDLGKALGKKVNEGMKALNSLTGVNSKPCPDGTKRTEDAQEELDERKDKEEELKAAANLDKYKRFLSELESRNHVLFVDVPHDEIDAFTDSSFFGLIGGDFASRSEQIKARIDAMRKAQGNGTPEWAANGPTAAPAGSFGDVKKAAKEYAEERDPDDRKDIKKELGEDTQTNEGGTNFLSAMLPSNPKRNHVRLNFLFLGGILEVAFGAARRDSALKEIRNIVGPYDYRDPVTGNKENVCLADIPISLNMFKIWFFENCVVPQREQWLLKDFLQQLISGLVGPAMGKDCFGACANGFRTVLNARIMEIPLCDDLECRITGTKSVDSFGGNSTSNIGSLEITPYPTGDNAVGLKSGSYYFLYATGASTNMPPPSAGETREKRDAGLGVYHFVLGADRGLVKKISFKREDAPHVTAARIKSDGPGMLALRSMYNADVDMVGNTMFVPGQLVFIDPGAFSVYGDSGSRGSPANVLGIGGYYLITKAQNFIESGKFETKLTCIWQSFGEGKKSDTDKYCQPQKCPEREDCEESEEKAPAAPKLPSPGELPSP